LALGRRQTALLIHVPRIHLVATARVLNLRLEPTARAISTRRLKNRTVLSMKLSFHLFFLSKH
jgi:hypothetical protein